MKRLYLFLSLSLTLLVACGVPTETHEKLQSDFQALQQGNSTLAAQYTNLQARYGDLETAMETLRAQQAALKEDLSQTRDSLDGVRKDLQTVGSQKADLEATAATLTQSVAKMTAERDTLQESFDALKQATGDLAAVKQARATLDLTLDALKKDISDMEAKRRALIPDMHQGRIICSGSMDPAITCMDRVTWLENPKPHEIVKGAVISFDPPDDCTLTKTDLDVAHRVIDIREDSSGVFLRTKGDNNLADDGCWVPFSRVTGLLTGLIKGSNAEMEALLAQIWGLEDLNDALYTKMLALNAEIDKLRDTYEQADAAYRKEYDRYCSGTPKGSTCILEPSVFDMVKPLYDQSMVALSRINVTIDAYNTLRTEFQGRRAQIRTLRNQLETLRCTKLFTCTPYPIP